MQDQATKTPKTVVVLHELLTFVLQNNRCKKKERKENNLCDLILIL